MPNTKPTVYILESAYKLMRGYVLASDQECSMIGEVIAENKAFVINKIHLPEQTCSPAFTKITNNGIANLLSKEGVDPAKLKCWIHSHVNMSCSPSGQDDKQAQELMQDAEWFIRIIMNKREEYSLFIHWNGIDIEGNLQIMEEDSLDIAELKKELEAVTVVETLPPITHKDNNFLTFESIYYDEYFPKNGKKKKKNTNKLSYSEHATQCPWLLPEDHEIYKETSHAMCFAAFMDACKHRGIIITKSKEEYDAYIEYLWAMDSGETTVKFFDELLTNPYYEEIHKT